MVQEVRRPRFLEGRSIDWVVMRNRLSMLGTRNKRLVGAALQELSQRLDFRMVDGFAERMIFREFYPRGLTALDDFDEAVLGTRPTMSHATARQEVASLLTSLNLGMFTQEAEAAAPDEDLEERDRHAA
jgi:chromosome partitioning protein